MGSGDLIGLASGWQGGELSWWDSSKISSGGEKDGILKFDML
mgnify:CR=1 FL=1